MDKVCVVTVTYGKRWKLLREVLTTLISHHPAISDIIVVDNGSDDDIPELVSQLESDKIKVIRLDENTGSANGFKVGIEAALNTEAEFLWLLDDDNRPEPGCLERLLGYYWALGNDPLNCLLALRERQRHLMDLVERGYSADVRPNSFLGFHWRDVPRKISKRIHWGRTSIKSSAKFPLVILAYAPYGGLLFHRSWVDKVGLPDERFFVYSDDHEYTWRFTRHGGRIYLCANCRVEDIDVSWHHKAHHAHPFLSPLANILRQFYGARNQAYFEITCLVQSKVEYAFNVVLYIAFMLLKSLAREGNKAGVLGRLRVFVKALCKGWAGELGIANEKDLKL